MVTNWIQILELIVSILAIGASLFGIVKWAVSDLKKQVSNLDLDLKTTIVRMDASITRMDARMDASSSEISRLYHMFVDLLRDNNKEKRERKVKK